jgi:hypothetical protein
MIVGDDDEHDDTHGGGGGHGDGPFDFSEVCRLTSTPRSRSAFTACCILLEIASVILRGLRVKWHRSSFTK